MGCCTPCASAQCCCPLPPVTDAGRASCKVVAGLLIMSAGSQLPLLTTADSDCGTSRACRRCWKAESSADCGCSDVSYATKGFQHVLSEAV